MARKHRETHTVVLDSGGKISFKFNFRSFRLTERDRELVAHLIDTVRDYEAASEVREAEEVTNQRRRRKRNSTEENEEASPDPVVAEV